MIYSKYMNKQSGIAHIILILFLLVGLVIGVIFVQKQNIFQTKSKASNPVALEAFEYRDANGKLLECTASNNPEEAPTCITPTQDITIKVIKPELLQPN